MRLAAFGRGITGDEDARYLHVVVLLHQPDGVGYGIELGPVVLVVGYYPVTVLAELKACGTRLCTHLHRFRLRRDGIETILRYELRQHAGHQQRFRLAFAAIHAAVHLFAHFDTPFEHPALVGQRGGVIVNLLPAVAAPDDYLRFTVVIGRQLHAFEAPGTQIHIVSRLTVHHNRRKGGLPAAVARHEHGCQRHRVLRSEPHFAQVHRHRQAYLAGLFLDRPVADFDGRKIGNLLSALLGMRRRRAARQYQQKCAVSVFHRFIVLLFNYVDERNAYLRRAEVVFGIGTAKGSAGHAVVFVVVGIDISHTYRRLQVPPAAYNP